MANCVDPDETARYEPSHLDLHCLKRYLFLSVRLEGLTSVAAKLNTFLENEIFLKQRTNQKAKISDSVTLGLLFLRFNVFMCFNVFF